MTAVSVLDGVRTAEGDDGPSAAGEALDDDASNDSATSWSSAGGAEPDSSEAEAPATTLLATLVTNRDGFGEANNSEITY